MSHPDGSLRPVTPASTRHAGAIASPQEIPWPQPLALPPRPATRSRPRRPSGPLGRRTPSPRPPAGAALPPNRRCLPAASVRRRGARARARGGGGAGECGARRVLPCPRRAPPAGRRRSSSSRATRCGRSRQRSRPTRDPREVVDALVAGPRHAPRCCRARRSPGSTTDRHAGCARRARRRWTATVAACAARTAGRTTTRSSTRASPTRVARSGAGASASPAGAGTRPTSGSRTSACSCGSARATVEPFDRAKLRAGVERAATNRLDAGDVDTIVAEVEEELRDAGGEVGERAGRPGRARAAADPRPRRLPAVRVGLQGLRGPRRLRARGRRAPEDDRPEAALSAARRRRSRLCIDARVQTFANALRPGCSRARKALTRV